MYNTTQREHLLPGIPNYNTSTIYSPVNKSRITVIKKQNKTLLNLVN